jgi:hypothetical protein
LFLEKIKKKVNENVFGSNVCRFHYIQTLLELEDTDAENILLSVKSNLEQRIKKGFLLFLADYLELISDTCTPSKTRFLQSDMAEIRGFL